jgi:hypothetical protein
VRHAAGKALRLAALLEQAARGQLLQVLGVQALARCELGRKCIERCKRSRRGNFRHLAVESKLHALATAVKAEAGHPANAVDECRVRAGDETAFADRRRLGGVQAVDHGAGKAGGKRAIDAARNEAGCGIDHRWHPARMPSLAARQRDRHAEGGIGHHDRGIVAQEIERGFDRLLIGTPVAGPHVHEVRRQSAPLRRQRRGGKGEARHDGVAAASLHRMDGKHESDGRVAHRGRGAIAAQQFVYDARLELRDVRAHVRVPAQPVIGPQTVDVLLDRDLMRLQELDGHASDPFFADNIERITLRGGQIRRGGSRAVFRSSPVTQLGVALSVDGRARC